MTGLTQFAGWSAWYARIPSFTTAVLITWLLNRTLTFPGRGLQRRSTEALLYGVIQAVRRRHQPGDLRALPASAGRSSASCRWCRWRSARSAASSSTSPRRTACCTHAAEHSAADEIDAKQQAYSGADNLEAMSEAENYNRYLLDLVRSHAPPRWPAS